MRGPLYNMTLGSMFRFPAVEADKKMQEYKRKQNARDEYIHQRELDLREKELALKEKELEIEYLKLKAECNAYYNNYNDDDDYDEDDDED